MQQLLIIEKMNRRYNDDEIEDVDEGFYQQAHQFEELTIQHHQAQHQDETFQSIQDFKSYQHIPLQLIQRRKRKINSIKRNQIKDHYSTKYMNVSSVNQGPKRTEDEASIEVENRSTLSQNKSAIKYSKSKKYQQEEPYFKSKRNNIGDQIILQQFHGEKKKEIYEQERKKSYLVKMGYERDKYKTSHIYYKMISLDKNCTFLQRKQNEILRKKIYEKDHQVENHKFYDIAHTNSSQQDPILFQSNFQSSNLDFSLKLSNDQYNLYPSVDTHTSGHEGWFYFKISNSHEQSKRIKINVLNIKKKFKLFQEGQKIYVKKANSWSILNEQIQFSSYARKLYKITFLITIQPKSQIFLSLLPPYTYSQLLQDLHVFNKSPSAKIETLTYSLTGLAIPMITITKDSKSSASKNSKKKLFIISGRIHPAEVSGSFVIKGLINRLLAGGKEMQNFLSKAIIKIIPMMNPDGVVFGNFRTNYLGEDLNRAFNRTDEIIYPEIIALKQLLKQSKQIFHQNLVAFIDFHGHSSKPNSFIYGPQFSEDNDNYYDSRILPKIIDKISRFFSYQMSSFKLEEYKQNTARGFITKKHSIISYTIQTSYALFQQKNEPKRMSAMGIPEWLQLGQQIAYSLLIYTKYLLNKKRSITQSLFKSNIIGDTKFNNLTAEMKQSLNDRLSSKEVSFYDIRKQLRNQILYRKQKNNQSSDSDIDDAQQDLPPFQKQKVMKKIKQASIYQNYLFAKINKPAMILPSIVPSIGLVKSQPSQQPKIFSKMKPRKINRPVRNSNQYTESLIKNPIFILNLRPDIRNFSKLSRKNMGEQLPKY